MVTGLRLEELCLAASARTIVSQGRSHTYRLTRGLFVQQRPLICFVTVCKLLLQVVDKVVIDYRNLVARSERVFFFIFTQSYVVCLVNGCVLTHELYLCVNSTMQTWTVEKALRLGKSRIHCVSFKRKIHTI